MLGFADSDLSVNRGRTVEILKYFNKMNKKRIDNNLLPIAIHMETSLLYFNDAIIEEIVKIPQTYHEEKGVSCGLQSLDEEVVRISNRKLDREKFIKNYNKLRDKGFKNIMVEIIHGLPGDSKEKFRKTLDDLISEINVDFFMSNHFCLVEGSRFYYEAEKYGLKWSDDPHHRLISSNTFPKEDLEEVDLYVCYMGAIYHTPLKRIKTMVDRKFKKNKIKVYDEIIKLLDEKYHDFFTGINNFYDLMYMIEKMNDHESYPVRQKIIQDVKTLIDTIDPN
jgi:radical SAM superfamily enzyme YgiQ (UPF0313 family)